MSEAQDMQTAILTSDISSAVKEYTGSTQTYIYTLSLSSYEPCRCPRLIYPLCCCVADMESLPATFDPMLSEWVNPF